MKSSATKLHRNECTAPRWNDRIPLSNSVSVVEPLTQHPGIGNTELCWLFVRLNLFVCLASIRERHLRKRNNRMPKPE